jgi:hypothetical protein
VWGGRWVLCFGKDWARGVSLVVIASWLDVALRARVVIVLFLRRSDAWQLIPEGQVSIELWCFSYIISSRKILHKPIMVGYHDCRLEVNCFV